MKRWAIMVVSGVALAVVGVAIRWSARDEPHPPIAYNYFGATMVARSPHGDPRTLMVLIAPSAGDERTEQLAEHLLGLGVASVIVPLPDLEKAEGLAKDGCVDLGRILHAVANDAEHRLKFATFRVPLLGGVDTGALAAYTAYRQSGAGTWGGILTVDRAGNLALPLPPCYHWGTPGETPGTYTIDLKHRVGEVWVDLSGLSDARFEVMISTLLAKSPAGDNASGLPVTFVEPDRPVPTAPYVVMYSGDGGWAGLDQSVAAEFARRGYSVAGISSLAYFWEKHEPAEAARDLESLISANAGARNILLVGYSFGADALPFIYAELSPETKSRIVRLDLLGFSNSADFEFHLGSWADVASDNARPTVPFVDGLHDVEVRCIRGIVEKESACPLLRNPAVVQISLPGDHHFNGDAKAVVDAMIGAAAIDDLTFLKASNRKR